MKLNRLLQLLMLTVFALSGSSAFAFKLEFDFDVIEEDWEVFENEGPMGKGTFSVELPDEAKDNQVRLQKLLWDETVLKDLNKTKKHFKKRIDKLQKTYEKLAGQDKQRKHEIDKFNKDYLSEGEKLGKRIEKAVKETWKDYVADLEDASKKVKEARIDVGFTLTKTGLTVGAAYASGTATGGLALAGTVLKSWSSLKESYTKMVEHNQSTEDAREELEEALEAYQKVTGSVWENIKSRGKDIKEELTESTLDDQVEKVGEKLLKVLEEGDKASWADWSDESFESVTGWVDLGLKALEPASSKLQKSLDTYQQKLAFETKSSDSMGSYVSSLLGAVDALEKDETWLGWTKRKTLMPAIESGLDYLLKATVASQESLQDSKELVKEVEGVLASKQSINKTFEQIEKGYGLLKSVGETAIKIWKGDYIEAMASSMDVIQEGVKNKFAN